MTLIIPVLSVVITVLVIELLSLNILRRIVFRCEVNMSLTEPDEVATLTYRVYNTSSWPIMFVSFSFLFHESIQVRETAAWQTRHGTQGFLGTMYGRELFLMPHKGVKGTIAFSLKKRGSCSDLGRIYLETGDFLGLKSEVASCEVGLRMVCTARLTEREQDIRALGGLLGEISVRRFIQEDPSLVLGYRAYTGHEPIKDISWAQTAKTGTLMVKKHDFTTDCDTAVLLDIEATEEAIAERCLSLVRTACEYLEEQRIPYSLHSNGDLFETERGIGRKHLFEIQRRIGESHFTRYESFQSLIHQVSKSGRKSQGYIIILPRLDAQSREWVACLNARSDTHICLLLGEEEPK